TAQLPERARRIRAVRPQAAMYHFRWVRDNTATVRLASSMGLITATDLLRGVINWLVLATMFGALASWVWVLSRLLRHQPLLPEAPLVERRGTPWGIGTMLLLVAAWFLVSIIAPQRYAAAARGHRDRPRAEAAHEAKKPGAEP